MPARLNKFDLQQFIQLSSTDITAIKARFRADRHAPVGLQWRDRRIWSIPSAKSSSRTCKTRGLSRWLSVVPISRCCWRTRSAVSIPRLRKPRLGSTRSSSIVRLAAHWRAAKDEVLAAKAEHTAQAEKARRLRRREPYFDSRAARSPRLGMLERLHLAVLERTGDIDGALAVLCEDLSERAGLPAGHRVPREP